MLSFKQNIQYDMMKNHFLIRTKNHINLVNKYALLLESLYPELNGLSKNTINHDNSKFNYPEMEPYILLTWQKKLHKENKEFLLSNEQNNEIIEATKHHILNNPHHPEFHQNETNVLSKNNRDSSDIIIDSTNMDILSLGEMCADWMAMSFELNTSPIDWANKNINKRWKFNDFQINKIYEYIKKF